MTEELRQRIESCVQKHKHDPDWPWPNSKIGKYIKYKGAHPRATEIAEVTSGMDFRKAVTRGPAAKKASKPGMTKREFLEEYDPYTRTLRDINRGLTKLENDRYIKDNEFRKLCGVGDLRMWRDVVVDPDEGFTGYQFLYGDQRWWTTEKSAGEMIAANLKAKAIE